MDISFSQKALIPEDVVFRDLDGESVLLNLDNENYYGLDEVGTRIWHVLTTSNSIQEAYQTLLAEYDTTPEILRQDIIRLIDELTTQGLIELSDG